MNHSGVAALFWKIAWLKARIENVSQENRCSPCNVLEEDVRCIVTIRLSTAQFFFIKPLNQALNALLLRTEQLSWTKAENSDRRVLSRARENSEAIASTNASLEFHDFCP
jgi:hypothetical protein